MSIFDTLKNAIFGHTSAAQTSPSSGTSAPPTGQTAASAPATQATSSATASSVGASTAGSRTGAGTVDVEAVLDELKTRNGQNLNWRTSIVDLMKLVSMDSSLQHRKDLAKELGYTGSTDDSAAMNVWLHKEVMTRLAQNGGKVPDALLH